MGNVWWGEGLCEMRPDWPCLFTQKTYFQQLPLKARQNFTKVFISLPLEEWGLWGAGLGMSQCMSAARAWRHTRNGEITTGSYEHEAICAGLITVLCDCSHILKLSMTQLRKSCLSASHPLPQRMKNSNLQGWACLMNVIHFCWTEDTRGFRGCELDARFVNDPVVLVFRWV